MSDRIIFLDIDGVLTSPLSHAIDPQLVRQVDHLARLTYADIVIASDRRFSQTEEEITRELREAGLLADIVGILPTHGGPVVPSTYPGWVKRHYIGAWMAKHGRPHAFVILDDDPRGLIDTTNRFDDFRHQYVWVDSRLCEYHIARAHLLITVQFWDDYPGT